jgi:hypothetical protein
MTGGRQVAVFPTEMGARNGLDRLRTVATFGLLRIGHAAVLTRDRASGTVGLSEERSASDQDQPYPGAARTLTGVASPCSPLISELLATFLGPALGLAEDGHRQRKDRQRASRHLKEGGSALAAIVEERLVARLKAGPGAATTCSTAWETLRR